MRTTRRSLAAVAAVGLALWMIAALYRVQDDRQGRWLYHLWERRNGAEEHPGSIIGSLCRAPFWPRYWRGLLGQPWPGSYRCPCMDPDFRIQDATSESYALVGTRTGPELGEDWSAGNVRGWQSLEPWNTLIREQQTPVEH